MNTLDGIVILIYLIGLVVIGLAFSDIKDTRTMFAAGGESPWWVSGLSSFMTFFSAGTFVVWGGIAFQLGLVAVMIQLCFGVAAFITGAFFASRWHRLGLTSASDYIALRFGRGALQFYVWVKALFSPFSLGTAVGAFCIMLCALVPLPEGTWFRDAATGNLSVTWALAGMVTLVTLYTLTGGLWAVLMTDVLQFVVLMVTVALVVPLAFMKVGGVGAFLDRAPEGFFTPTSGQYTWIFLGIFMVTNALQMGAEWHFAQRSMCVPTAKDARKGFYLFGALYLLSPLVWMLPPMIYRTIDPTVPTDEAYIRACRAVLPPGMVGLMIAAMFSATASSMSSVLNVMSGAVVTGVWEKFRGHHSEGDSVKAGRVITLFLGGLAFLGSYTIYRFGTVTDFVLGLNLINSALLLPTLWGFFSRRVGAEAVWVTLAVQAPLAVATKFGFSADGWFAGGALADLAGFYQTHTRALDLAIGFVVPFALLAFLEWRARGRVAAGWERIEAQCARQVEKAVPSPSTRPANMVAVAVGFIGLLLGVLALMDGEARGVLAAGAAAMLAVAGTVKWRALAASG